jgi:hypothetical protein
MRELPSREMAADTPTPAAPPLLGGVRTVKEGVARAARLKVRVPARDKNALILLF